VRTPRADIADRLQRLVDNDGSGNVSPIAGEVLNLAGVRFTGDPYASRRDRSLVVIAEATPAGGRPDNSVMDSAAQIAAEFPEP
jgi:hypothetical protein